MMTKILVLWLSSFMLTNYLLAGTGGMLQDSKTTSHVTGSLGSLVYVAPLQFTENGFGFSFGFEHSLNKEGTIAYCLPLVASYNFAKGNLIGPKNDPMYYLMPTLKFYFSGSENRTRYAIGPTFVAGLGKFTNDDYSQYYGSYQDKLILGVMVNNSVNISVSRNIYLGLECSYGFTYLRAYDSRMQPMGLLTEGGIKIGYKF